MDEEVEPSNLTPPHPIPWLPDSLFETSFELDDASDAWSAGSSQWHHDPSCEGYTNLVQSPSEDSPPTPEDWQFMDDTASDSATIDDRCWELLPKDTCESYALRVNPCHEQQTARVIPEPTEVNVVDLHALTVSDRFLRKQSRNQVGVSQAALLAGVQLERVGDTTPNKEAPEVSSVHNKSVEKELSAEKQETPPATKCPICERSIAGCGQLPISKHSAMSTGGRFAHYTPRVTARKDNRMAAWYTKYGYKGPRYCKACAESFASHLLKKAVRSETVVCTRTEPCRRCTILLGYFDVPKETVFCLADEKKRDVSHTSRRQTHPRSKCNRVPKQKQKQMKRPTSGENGVDKTSPLLNKNHAGFQPERTQSKRRRSGAIVATVVAFSMALMSDHWIGSTASEGSTTNDETKWVCGASATGALANASLSPSAIAAICGKGMSPLSTFACTINDCAKGQVPIGERTCRCDGCFEAKGRCAGWILDGYGPTFGTTGCEDAITPDPQPYIWRVPGVLNDMGCDVMSTDTVGCLDASLSEKGQCELSFSRPWPQPMSQAWDAATRFGGTRAGTIWSNDDRDVWYYTLDDAGVMHFAGVDYQIDPNTTSSMDLHFMWKYDAKTGRWKSFPSSLKERPGPRSGAGQWVDSAGSLFLLGGLPTENLGTESIVPFSVFDVDSPAPGLSLDAVELWRYDTQAATWHSLHTQWRTTQIQDDADTFVWPLARAGAAVWRDRGKKESPDSTNSDVTIWMFAGWTRIPSNGTTQQRMGELSTELWQYVYTYASSDTLDANDLGPGEWKLVSAAPQTASGASTLPLHICANVSRSGSLYGGGQVQGEIDMRAPDCPCARMDAGSWSSPNAAAG